MRQRALRREHGSPPVSPPGGTPRRCLQPRPPPVRIFTLTDISSWCVLPRHGRGSSIDLGILLGTFASRPQRQRVDVERVIDQVDTTTIKATSYGRIYPELKQLEEPSWIVEDDARLRGGSGTVASTGSADAGNSRRPAAWLSGSAATRVEECATSPCLRLLLGGHAPRRYALRLLASRHKAGRGMLRLLEGLDDGTRAENPDFVDLVYRWASTTANRRFDGAIGVNTSSSREGQRDRPCPSHPGGSSRFTAAKCSHRRQRPSPSAHLLRRVSGRRAAARPRRRRDDMARQRDRAMTDPARLLDVALAAGVEHASSSVRPGVVVGLRHGRAARPSGWPSPIVLSTLSSMAYLVSVAISRPLISAWRGSVVPGFQPRVRATPISTSGIRPPVHDLGHLLPPARGTGAVGAPRGRHQGGFFVASSLHHRARRWRGAAGTRASGTRAERHGGGGVEQPGRIEEDRGRDVAADDGISDGLHPARDSGLRPVPRVSHLTPPPHFLATRPTTGMKYGTKPRRPAQRCVGTNQPAEGVGDEALAAAPG